MTKRFTRRLYPLIALILLVVAPGCGSTSSTFFNDLLDALLGGLNNGNNNFNDNQNNNANDPAQVLFFVHGRTFDGITELNVTIDTLELLDDHGEVAAVADLDESVRVNLINPDYSELFACFIDVPAGDYARLRLLVRNPELVLDDDSVIPADDIDLTIAGAIEIVSGPTGVPIDADTNNVIEFDLATRDDSILVTDNGDGSVTLDSEIFFEVFGDLADPVLLSRGLIAEIDEQTGSSDIFYLVAASNCDLTVFTDDATDFFDPNGDPIDPLDLATGDIIGFEGDYDDVNDVMTATVVQRLE